MAVKHCWNSAQTGMVGITTAGEVHCLTAMEYLKWGPDCCTGHAHGSRELLHALLKHRLPLPLSISVLLLVDTVWHHWYIRNHLHYSVLFFGSCVHLNAQGAVPSPKCCTKKRATYLIAFVARNSYGTHHISTYESLHTFPIKNVPSVKTQRTKYIKMVGLSGGIRLASFLSEFPVR